MRFALFVMLGLCLALPARAQNALPAPQAGAPAHNYGGATCPQPVPCPNDAGDTSTADLAASASNCVTRYLGIGNPNGFFDEDMGLDRNNCLTPKPNAIPKMASNQTAPHCCVISTSETTCAFHCDIVSVP